MVSDRSATVIEGWTEVDVVHGGVTLHVHRAGNPDGPTLVLAHGLSDSGRCWWRVAEALSGELDLVMLDARNHGQSSTVVDATTTSVDDVAAVIDALGLDQPMLMGHSLGARMMAALAAGQPRSASRLVLVDPPFGAEGERRIGLDPARRDGIRAWLASFDELTRDDIVALGHRQHADWPDDEFATWAESKQQVRTAAADDFPSTPWGEIVSAIECPTLLVHGEPARGGIVTDDVVARIVELNPLVEATCVTGSGHNIHRENFDAFIDVVRSFLFV